MAECILCLQALHTVQYYSIEVEQTNYFSTISTTVEKVVGLLNFCILSILL
jgi:hypothetical protein